MNLGHHRTLWKYLPVQFSLTLVVSSQPLHQLPFDFTRTTPRISVPNIVAALRTPWCNRISDRRRCYHRSNKSALSMHQKSATLFSANCPTVCDPTSDSTHFEKFTWSQECARSGVRTYQTNTHSIILIPFPLFQIWFFRIIFCCHFIHIIGNLAFFK